MTTPIRFAKGDTVRHPKRPEWGMGTVRDLQAIAQPDGTRAQRLTVDFANQGRKLINTAVAPLTLAGTPAKPEVKTKTRRNTPQAPLPNNSRGRAVAAVANGGANGGLAEGGAQAVSGSGISGGSGWLDTFDDSSKKTHELWELPDTAGDPFASLPERLKATLETYRFSTDPKSLIEWGVAQTGLDDPLSKYTRHELEQAFPRFARDRDLHLRDIVRQLKRASNHAALKDAGRGLFSAAQSALDKAIRS